MALQIRPVSINWTDEFTNPARYEAAIRNNLASNNSPAVQQAVRSTPVSAPVQQAQQQIVQQQQAQRFVAPQVSASATPAPNFWGTIGSFLGADAFKRTGEGIAEIIAELNGTNKRMRDQKAQQDQQDLTLIRHYGDLIKNGDPNTKQRAQQALASLMRTSDTADKDFQARQQQIIERTDPVKGAAALGEIGLDIATAGVGTKAAKGGIDAIRTGGKFFTPQLAKDAAAGAGIGALYGANGTVEQQGAQTNVGDVAKNAAIGAALGGATPIAGKLIGRGIKYVVDERGNPVPVPQADIPKQLNHYTTAEAKRSINSGGFEIRKTKSVQGDGVYFLNKDDPSMVMADVVNEAKIRGKLAKDTKIIDLNSPEYKGPSPTSGNKLRKYALRNGFDGATDSAQTVIYNADKILNGRKTVEAVKEVNAQPKVSFKAGEQGIGESNLTKPSARLKKGETQDFTQLDTVNPEDVFNNRNIVNRVRNELATKFIDSDSNILKLLGRIEKETGRTGLVDQFYYDSGRVRASNTLADARIANNDNVRQALEGLQDYTAFGRKIRELSGGSGKSQLDRFDEYAGARAELNNYKGLKTSRSKEENAAIVAAGHDEFGDRFDALNRWAKEQSQLAYESGLIDKKTNVLNQKSDNYIRIQRNMEDIVQPQLPGSKSLSIGSHTLGQKRRGSTREILSPTRSMLKRAQEFETQVQRNVAANHLIDTLSDYGLARRVGHGTNTNTIERFRGGKKEFWEVPGDIVKEVKNLEPKTLGVTMQILGAPNRLLRAGATGLNVPFAGANFLKDQVGSAIQSKYAWQTHDPRNIINGLWQATRDFGSEANDPLWKKFVEVTGNQTIYDELRNQKATNATLRELRLGKKGVAINRAMSPVRSLEDLIGITEKATRWQNFKGTYQKVLADTGNEKLTLQQATIAARKNTTDFNRAGDWGRVLNGFIPYFNASIQGSRSMARAFKERPIATSIKTVGTVALPTIAATLWNYADPARAEVYNSIDDYEKKDNWIIVGPDAHQNKDGSWSGVVKIPKPPGYRDLTDPVRDVTESFAKGQPSADAGRLLSDVLNAFGGPVQTGNLQQLEGSLLPQQVKPFIQAQMNKNLYTGKDIVPEFMNQATHPDGTPVANSDKAYTDTSGTSRALGKLFGVSPLIVDQFIRDSTASVGQYVQNTADQLGAAAGVIPKNQIGGKDILSDIEGRFAKANGTLLERNKTEGQKYFEARKEATKDLSPADMKAFDTLHPQTKNFLGEQVYDADSIYNSAKRLALYNTNPNIFQADKKLDAYARSQGSPGNPLFDLSGDNLKKVLEKGNLPPGAKDPELSNLYTKDWFVEYQNKKTAYYDYVAKQAAASGKPLGGSDNPYPTTPANVQQDMDYYNGLPKGTGARSGWIKANPDKWAAMQAQFAAVDNWQNEQRKKRGLDATEGAAGQANGYNTGSSSGGYSSKYGSKKSKAGINQYAYQVKRGGATVSLKAPKASVGAPKIAKAKISKPKVTLKKAAA